MFKIIEDRPAGKVIPFFNLQSEMGNCFSAFLSLLQAATNKCLGPMGNIVAHNQLQRLYSFLAN